MFYLSPEGDRYYLGRAFDYNDLQYTKAGATHDTFIGLGFTQVTPAPTPDPRFYIFSGPNNAGEYSSTPRDLDQLKLNFIMEQKTTARQLLSESDWYVLREAEGGAGVPVDFRNYRVSVRTIADARCAEIYAAETVADLEALITTASLMTEWPTQLSLEAVVAEQYGLEDASASSAY